MFCPMAVSEHRSQIGNLHPRGATTEYACELTLYAVLSHAAEQPKNYVVLL